MYCGRLRGRVRSPKTVEFFVAVLRQFVDVHASDVALQIMVLGAACTAIAVVLAGNKL